MGTDANCRTNHQLLSEFARSEVKGRHNTNVKHRPENNSNSSHRKTIRHSEEDSLRLNKTQSDSVRLSKDCNVPLHSSPGVEGEDQPSLKPAA